MAVSSTRNDADDAERIARPAALVPLIETAWTSAEEARRAEVTLQVAGDLDTVAVTDPERCVAALVGLLHESMAAAKRGALITVRVTRDIRQRVEISTKARTASAADRPGLELAIARALVAEDGGDVAIGRAPGGRWRATMTLKAA
jgi:predicted methyltransferase MtxX (methanogen marker protein 4)